MNTVIQEYNDSQNNPDKEICNQLVKIINTNLSEAENKITFSFINT